MATYTGKQEIRRSIISEAMQRIIGQLSLDQLKAIYEAEENALRASQQLGISAQIAAQDAARTVTREIFAGLSDYSIDRMEQDIKVSARDLNKINKLSGE